MNEIIVTAEILDCWFELIDKDLGTFTNSENLRTMLDNLVRLKMLKCFTIEDTGIFAYLISGDFMGGKTLSEILIYIRPEYRGSLKLLRQYINTAEQIAVSNGCNSIKIGANIKFKDSSFIKLLKRWGYEDDTVAKYL